MHAIGAKPLRKAHAVVYYEGDFGVGADALQRFGQTRQLVLADILHAKLERRGEPRLHRYLQTVAEISTDLLGADQIELCGLGPRRWREVERIVLGFDPGQAGTRAVEAS